MSSASSARSGNDDSLSADGDGEGTNVRGGAHVGVGGLLSGNGVELGNGKRALGLVVVVCGLEEGLVRDGEDEVTGLSSP